MLLKSLIDPCSSAIPLRTKYQFGSFCSNWLGLAALVEQYVLAINTPGVIPNVQNAWDSFVEAKCSDTLKDALDVYEVAMTTQLENEVPCDNDQLRRSHDVALQNSENHFMADTAGISINTIEKYLKKLKVRYKKKESKIQIVIRVA